MEGLLVVVVVRPTRGSLDEYRKTPSDVLDKTRELFLAGLSVHIHTTHDGSGTTGLILV